MLMDRSLMQRFLDSGFEPIAVDDMLVHPLFRTNMHPRDVVRVTWVSAVSPRVQGVTLRLRLPGVSGRRGEGGVLRVSDAEAPAIILWMDTAPSAVDVECVKRRDSAELQVSNRWRLENGQEHEWLNNFGMIIEPLQGEAFLLRCSDGYGSSPSFDDLVVRIDMKRGIDREANVGG
jgi:hypothetical protein